MSNTSMNLFPTDLPALRWQQFSAAGFSQPVSGVLFRTDKPPCCGVPLGGISTGCIDVDARGVYGFSSIFHPKSSRGEDHYTPRKLPSCEPIVGLSVSVPGQCAKTWVLASTPFIKGGRIPWCTNVAVPWGQELGTDEVDCRELKNVQPAEDIHYWGHYPVADMEFQTDAPVSVGMRAWSPLIPGDKAASNIPAAVFEVRLRNDTGEVQSGTVAFNFPGPDAQEARSAAFTRRLLEEDFHGMFVRSGGGVDYVLGVVGSQGVRFGVGLGRSEEAWSRIGDELPQPAHYEHQGVSLYSDASCSAAVDFTCQAGQSKVVRFLLAWYAPVWEGCHEKHLTLGVQPPEQFKDQYQVPPIGSPWAGDTHFYTQMYAARYDSSIDVARRMALEHESLLDRVLAWQSVIYEEESLPVWLRDCLVNNLCLITEDSHWAQAKPPLGDWCYPEGAFGLNESPRACPQMSCIPCDWYGNLPIVFFFPELARSSLRMFKQYQLESGEVPFSIGKAVGLPDFASPTYYWQVSTNGPFYLMLVDRLWQRSGDEAVLKEFYESAKRCNTFTMNLCQGPAGVISMPDIGGMEPFEMGEWAGMTSHLAGIRLAALRIMERMAEAIGDKDYAECCRTWYAEGSQALEQEMWNGNYYLNFYEKRTGRRSDDVMGYLLGGQWVARSHGVGDVFQADRIEKTLDTIERCNIALTAKIGATSFARPDGSPLAADDKVASYGQYSNVAPEVAILAMTYLYCGRRESGLELVHRHWANLVLEQGHGWDLPNMVRGDTGERLLGTDYYQNMVLWALPAAVQSVDIANFCAPHGLIDRILCAADQ